MVKYLMMGLAATVLAAGCSGDQAPAPDGRAETAPGLADSTSTPSTVGEEGTLVTDAADVNQTLGVYTAGEAAPAYVVDSNRRAVYLLEGDFLSEAQARAFDEYLTAIRIAYGDRISIDDPVAVGAAERRAAIAGVVARHGLLVEETAPVSSTRLAPGVTRIVITRSRASIPDCPDWSRPSNPELAASTMSNFGCATRSNLAEMVADPNDLVSGKAYEGADGHTINKATDAFRRRQPTGYKEGSGTMSAGSGAATGN